jgi:predicted dehydrogenase
LSLVDDDVQDVSAFGICVMGDHEDCVQARVTFCGGCIADLTASRISPTAARTMQLWSATGTVTIDFTTRDIVGYQPSDMLRYGTPPTERAQQAGADIEQLKRDVFGKLLKLNRPKVSQSDALTAELQDFVDCVQNGRAPRVGGCEALKAMELAERVLAAVAEHQWDGHKAGPVGPQPVFPMLRRMAG